MWNAQKREFAVTKEWVCRAARRPDPTIRATATVLVDLDHIAHSTAFNVLHKLTTPFSSDALNHPLQNRHTPSDSVAAISKNSPTTTS